jgi:tetratricopeptide (TPR) repeat protein
LRKLGKYDEAIAHYEKAIHICPDDEHLYFNCARAYYEKMEIGQAKEWVRRALKRDPGFQEAKDLLDRMEDKQPTKAEG